MFSKKPVHNAQSIQQPESKKQIQGDLKITSDKSINITNVEVTGDIESTSIAPGTNPDVIAAVNRLLRR
jgi:hypothetical protein